MPRSRRIAPEVAADWPAYRDLEGTLAGVAARRDNVSEVWAWLGSYALARRYAADLFDDVQLATVPILLEHTADELNALLGTMSFWADCQLDSETICSAENQALSPAAGPADSLQCSRLPGGCTAQGAHLTS